MNHPKLSNLPGFAFLALLTLLMLAPSLAQAQEKRIFIAPDDHTDYFWTADDVAYRAAFLQTIDYYLDQIDNTENDPSDFHARWNCDGSLWLWEYQQHRPEKAFERLIARIKDGHISAPLNALACTFGAQSAESVIRGMYYPGVLERKHDVRFPMAIAMENQTLPLGLSSIWAGSGAKYSWRGICNCATKMDRSNFNKRDHEMYWYTGLDGSRVLMKWYSFGMNNESIGGYAEARKPNQAIDWVLSNGRFREKHPWPTIGIFGQGWDDLKTLSDKFPKVARERSKDGLRVVVSNEEDFFREFESKHGDKIGTESLAYGNEWDLYCMSMAEQTARVRRAVEKLRTAEAMAVLLCRDASDVWTDLAEERQQAYMDIGLYWEHDWTADASEAMRTKRANWQRKLADRITNYANKLYEKTESQIGWRLQFDGEPTVAFFNPLGWVRTSTFEIPVTHAYRLVDRGSGKQLPMRFIKQDGKILAEFKVELPALGYRCFKLVREPDDQPLQSEYQTSLRTKGQLESDPFFLVNKFLSVAVDKSGVIRELTDLRTGKDYCGTEGLNVLGGTSPSGKARVPVVVYDTSDESQQRLKIQSFAPQRTVTYVLRKDSDTLEVTNLIEENFGTTLRWDFDFKVDSPTVWHEEVGAILKAKLVTEGGHYATKNARYDWLSLGHFLAIEGRAPAGQGGCIELANRDCAFFQLGDSTPNRLDSESSKISVLAGGQVDGPKLGIRNQHGDTKFTQRFAIRVGPSKFKAVDTMRWSLEQQNPSVLIRESGKPVNVNKLPPKASLLEIEGSPDVLLWALKPAEEGIEHGVIARLWNLGDAASIKLGTDGLESATKATHIETDIEPVAVLNRQTETLEFRPQQMRTFRLK